MKNVFYSLIALLAITACTSQPESKTVELPSAAYSNNRALEIAKVTLTDSITVLDIDASYRPHNWIRIDSESYLEANGKKYMISDGEGIDLDSLFWLPESGKATFTLLFDPLPINTDKFNFIETECEDCFKIYGINLADKPNQEPKLPRKFKKKHKEETDLQQDWKKGEATVSGKLIGYTSNSLDWSVIYNNPITGNESTTPLEIDDKGLFSANITVYNPTNLYITSKAAHIPIKVAPGKESNIIVNLPEFYRQNSRLLKNQDSYGKKYYYAGYLARLNNDLANEEIIQTVQADHRDAIGDMDANEYKAYLMDKYKESKAHNDTLDISPLAKKVIDLSAVFALQNKIQHADYELMEAFAKKNKLSREEAQKKYKSVVRNDDFLDYYELIPYNDLEIFLIPHINHNLTSLGYARGPSMDELGHFRYLSQHEKVSEEDRQFFKEFIDAQENNKPYDKISEMQSIFTPYIPLLDEYMNNSRGVGFLSQVWNTDDALLFDLINAQKINREIKNFNPLTDKQKEELNDFPEIFKQVLLEENDALLAKIEENKKKTGFTVLNPPTTSDEKLFVEMLKPFKGKVILVDVWATWCGPCRIANKEMEPLKAQLADEEDLVFLYLAGENSPENTWKNMIADLKGEHYRVNNEQWNYLSESLNARGVPTYIIIDREGNHSFHSTGFPGVSTMKSELMKALNKKG